MGYKDQRYGITKIIGKVFDNLQISWDADVVDVENVKKHRRYPVLLYTPDMNNTNEHFHVMLTRNQATKLRDWLDDFLKDTKKK